MINIHHSSYKPKISKLCIFKTQHRCLHREPKLMSSRSGIWINWCWNYLFWFLIANYYNYLVFCVIIPHESYQKEVKCLVLLIDNSGNFCETICENKKLTCYVQRSLCIFIWGLRRALINERMNIFVMFTFLQLCMMGVLQMCPV